MKSTNHILDTALEISDQAAELIRISSKKIKSFKSKGEISNLVTQTDIEADKLISSKIKESFPEHNIVSEELGSNNLHSDYTWYIDPIDGTNNFVHNYPSFAVSIGIFYKDNPFAGVVYDIPNGENTMPLKIRDLIVMILKYLYQKQNNLKKVYLLLDLFHMMKNI